MLAIDFPGGKRNLKMNMSPAQNSNMEGHNTKNKLKYISLLA